MDRVDDLLRDGAEWCNIQDIVRTSFKALLDLVKHQGDAIRDLERRLDEKAGWADVNAALEQKASIADINHSLTTLTHEVDGKCTAADAREILEQGRRESQADAEADRGAWQAHMARLAGEIQRKVDVDTSSRWATRDELERALDGKMGREALERIDHTEAVLSRKVADCVSREEMDVALRGKANVVEVDQILKGKVDVDSMVTAIKAKANRHEVAELIDESLREMKRQILNEVRRSAADSGQANMSDVITLLDQKANAADVHVILSGKVDRDEFVGTVNDKVRKRWQWVEAGSGRGVALGAEAGNAREATGEGQQDSSRERGNGVAATREGQWEMSNGKGRQVGVAWQEAPGKRQGVGRLLVWPTVWRLACERMCILSFPSSML